MSAFLKNLWSDEAGVILSAELVIILTIAVLGMVVGLSCLQQAMFNEFRDLSLAFQSMNQSFFTPSFRGCWKWWGGPTSFVAGSSFYDVFDGCVYGNGYGYGCGPCEIYGATNLGYSTNGCATTVGTTAVSTDPCATSAEPFIPASPSATPLLPTPDAASTPQ